LINLQKKQTLGAVSKRDRQPETAVFCVNVRLCHKNKFYLYIID